VQHYYGTQRRDVRLERELEAELDESSRILDQGLAAVHSSPSHQAVRREQAVQLADALARLPEDSTIRFHVSGRQ
jgi:RNA polymerase sigma-70 factor, ECF subfamily